MQINLNDSYHEQLVARDPSRPRPQTDRSFEELDCTEPATPTPNPSKPPTSEAVKPEHRSNNGNGHPHGGQDGKALVEIMPGDGPESAVAGLLAAFASTQEVPRTQSGSKVSPLPLPLLSPMDGTLGTSLEANRRDGPPTFGIPCRPQGLDPIPDEGARAMPMAVTVPEWRWCIPITASDSQCVPTLLPPHNGGNGVGDQGPCSNLRLPFGRSSTEAPHICAVVPEDCSQLIVPSSADWDCVARVRKEETDEAAQLPFSAGTSRNFERKLEDVMDQVTITPVRRRPDPPDAPRTPPLPSTIMAVLEQKPVVATTPRTSPRTTPCTSPRLSLQNAATPATTEALREAEDLQAMGKMQGPAPALSLPVFPSSGQAQIDLSSPIVSPSTPTNDAQKALKGPELAEGQADRILEPVVGEEPSDLQVEVAPVAAGEQPLSIESLLVPEASTRCLGVNAGDKSPSISSRASTDSVMPLEFSDIDEPPTMAVASGNERASFTDTNEIPMALPKMGKRRCVTQCFTSDGRRELSLGLRAMVTLDDVQHNH